MAASPSISRHVGQDQLPSDENIHRTGNGQHKRLADNTTTGSDNIPDNT